MAGIAAVVVTYNRQALLRECLAALLGQQGAVCDVLVVDNASTDGTGAYVQALAAEQPRVHYANTGANLGGAGGFQYGMRAAVQQGYDYVWIMDDDTVPQPDALAQLMAADRAAGGPEKYGFLSSCVFWVDGSECKMNRQKLKKAFYNRLDLLRESMVLVEQATFVSLLFPAAVIRRAGLPIKEYFIWGDDIEYTRRLAVRMGLPCYLVGRSAVTHKMKNNEGSSIARDDVERIGRYNYAYRNDNSTYRREGLRGFCYYTAKCGLNLFRVLAFARDHRLRRCAIIVRCFFAGLAFNPAIEMV